MQINVQRIQIAMANACMGVDDLSSASGVSRISIGKYLSGKREPRPKTLGQIARALNVPVTDIIVDAAATADSVNK